MASRQEEKEARRKARLEQEAAEQKAATRNRRLQLLGGGVLALGITAAVVIGIGAAGGDDKSGGDGPSTTTASKVKLPQQEVTDLDAAAKAAQCTLTNPVDEGRGHEGREFTAADYKTNPPTSGTHDPTYPEDGIFATENRPPLGQLVHLLEHGRINVQYKPGTDPKLVSQLEAFVVENGPYHMVMYENQTNMEPQVAATAWDHMISCPEPGPKTWDALRTFRDRYLDQGPEKGL